VDQCGLLKCDAPGKNINGKKKEGKTNPAILGGGRRGEHESKKLGLKGKKVAIAVTGRQRKESRVD